MKMAGGVADARGSSQGGLGGDGSTSSGPEVYCASIASTEESAGIHRDAGGLRVLRTSRAPSAGSPRANRQASSPEPRKPPGRRISRGVRFGRQRGGRRGRFARGRGRVRGRRRSRRHLRRRRCLHPRRRRAATLRLPVGVSTFVGVGWSRGRPPARRVGVGVSVPPEGCGPSRAAMREHSRPRAELLAAKLGTLHPRRHALVSSASGPRD